MEHKISRQTSINTKKRRSFPFLFSSHKRTFSLPPDDHTRYYNFVDTPMLYKPSSPLIERQKFSPDLEAQIRYSCSLLVYNIERTEQLESSNAPETSTKDQQKPEISSSTDEQDTVQKVKQDFGGELETSPSKRQGVEITQISPFHESSDLDETSSCSNGNPSTAASSPATIATPHAYYTGDSSIQPSIKSPKPNEIQFTINGTCVSYSPPQNQDTKAFLARKDPHLSTNDDDNAENVEEFLNPDASNSPDATFKLDRAQSLCRPRTTPSLLTNKQHFENLQGTSWSDAERSSLQGLRISRRPATAVEFGATCIGKKENKPPVIVDSSGRPHVMTDAEEMQRHIDLQRAVKEKMYTGIIKSTLGQSQGQSPLRHHTCQGGQLNTAQQKRISFWSLRSLVSKESSTSLMKESQFCKGKSPLRNIFEFGKRKANSAVGFRRISETR